MRYIFITIVFLLVSFNCPSIRAETNNPTANYSVITNPGKYQSPNGWCPISIVTSSTGGYKQLVIPTSSGKEKVINDITGIAYLNDKQIAITVSPIYGEPGIYLHDCSSIHTKPLVKPTHFNESYAAGTDYFELYKVDRNKIYFYYAPDVDEIDFVTFRDRVNLYEVKWNGTGFKKAEKP